MKESNAIKNLRKADKYLRGMRRLGEITHDEEMTKEANEALYKNAILKSKIWYNRTMAKNYNLELVDFYGEDIIDYGSGIIY